MRRLEQHQPLRTPPVVAVYARYSDEENQGENSIEDQIRVCRQAAQSKGWVFDATLVFADAGISGETLSTRPDVVRLIAAIEATPRAFDGIVFDDTSRLGRNAAHVLHVCDVAKYHGVFLYFVNQGLDSRDRSFSQQMVPQAAADQQFNDKLRQGVVRGMQGRILNGYAAGGSHFGYKAEIVSDPTRRGSLARPAILGVRLSIDPVEAHAVRRIFDLADQGLSMKKIAAQCASEHLPLPARSRATTWKKDLVATILHSELYCGRLVWGRTTTMKHPTTGKMKTVPVPESEWTRNEVPELAIVTREQFERVQRIIGSHKAFGIQRLGGIGRRKDNREPLFSGNLRCPCGGSIVVVGMTATGERVLRCANYHERRTDCSNSFTVTEDTLEKAIVNHLVGEVLRPEALEFTVTAFYEALKHEQEVQFQEAKKRRATLPALNRERRQVERSIKRIVDSLIQDGSSKALRSTLESLESRLETIERQQLPAISVPERVSFEQAKSFVLDRSRGLSEVLLSNRSAAQLALRKHVGQLTLTPGSQDGMPVFFVSAGVNILSGELGAMPSENLSRLLQHCQDFRMKFLVVIPARTRMRNPLINKECDAKEVAKLAATGMTVKQIAQALRTTKWLVRRALGALKLKPNPVARVDYLHHPRCKSEDVMRLRAQGKTCVEIAEELSVSNSTVLKVMRAIAEDTGQPFKRLNRAGASHRSPVNYLAHPRCPAEKVAVLRKSGLTMFEIAQEFDVSVELVRTIIRAIEKSTGQPLEPERGRRQVYLRKQMDYLNHPRCPVSEVESLREQALPLRAIAEKFGISVDIVRRVLQARRDPNKRYRGKGPRIIQATAIAAGIAT